MRSYRFVIFFVVFVFVGTYGEENVRQKRFLSVDFFNPLSERLVNMAREMNLAARDLNDKVAVLGTRLGGAAMDLTQQASVVAPQIASERLRGSPIKSAIDKYERPKRRKGSVFRETETEEVEVFEPVKVDTGAEPDGGDLDVLDGDLGGLFPFFAFNLGRLTPWWEGPNICVEMNEVEEPQQDEFNGFSINFETTQCSPSESAYVCTRKLQTNGMRKSIVIRKQCCHGYVRRSDGKPGCSELKMGNVVETLKTLEMNKFFQWVESSRLSDQLSEGNYTVFAPSNEAVVDFEDETEDNEISAINPVRRLGDNPTIVAAHVVDGFVNLDNVENEQMLKTMDGQGTIRINKYYPSSDVVMTANCVPVTAKNNFAKNGIVHLTSAVLPPLKTSIGQLLEEDARFSTFKKLLERSGYLEELKAKDQLWTVFVPTNEAFDKLPRSLRNSLDSGEGCVQTIIAQHIVKGVTICSSAVVSRVKVRNAMENFLLMTKDESEKMRVDGVEVDSQNIVATNGVMHTIDKVLIAPQARSLLQLLEDAGREDLINLLQLSDLIEEIEKKDNVTLFLPVKEAFKKLPNETFHSMLEDPEVLKKVLKHHFFETHLPARSFSDSKKLKNFNGNNVHIKLNTLFPGLVTGASLQCANVLGRDNSACGAIVHQIDKVLLPPEEDIMETLKRKEGFGIITKLLENTDLATKLKEEGPFTLLAPTDKALENDDLDLDLLLENNTMAETFLKHHILPEILCCSGVVRSSPLHHQYLRAMDGCLLPLRRSASGHVRVGNARITQCDIVATNGVVQAVARPLTHVQRPSLFGMQLWPLF